MDCNPPGSSAHGISQVRILEWVAISFSRGSSWPRNQTQVSCIGRWILYSWATGEAQRFLSVQLNSVLQSCPTLCDPMNFSTTGLPVHHQLPEFTRTHVPWAGDAIQPSYPLSCPSPPALNLSQHQGFFKWVNSSHQVAKVLEFQLQYQSFQWMFRIDFL